MLHVPYKGSNNAMPDLLVGNVSVFFDSVPSSMPLVRNGKLRALGVVGAKRLATIPDIPTLAEAGLPGFDAKKLVRTACAHWHAERDRPIAEHKDGEGSCSARFGGASG